MSNVSLPAPPQGDPRWSIVTLAEYLCITPAAVDGNLTVTPDDDSEDLTSARIGVSYVDRDGDDLGDCFMHDEAAERIATLFPVGPLARAVLADEPEMAALLGWDQIYAMAQHIVEMAGASVAPASSRTNGDPRE